MTDDNEDKEAQLEDLFKRSYNALQQRIERDHQTALPITDPHPGEEAATYLDTEKKMASLKCMTKRGIKAASITDMRTLEWLANTLIDLQGGEIEKPSTFDDAEVPQEMIEEAAAHWGVTVKEVEQYVWDLHDRGAPYQFIKDYLRDIED